MKKAPIPFNEFERKRALDALKILDTPSEEAFDQITELAASICQTKLSLVSLIDTHRQWFKSRFGLLATETARDISFCGHAIMGEDIFEVEDSALHPDFCDNPLFLGEPNVRFYAGAPLITSGGMRIGTLCVIDSNPKKLSELQRKTLKSLAKQVVALFELRIHRDSLQSVYSQLREAQSIAKTGSWQYDLLTGEQLWSTEHYKIFEIEEPQPQEKLYQLYRERIHPEDLPYLNRFMDRAAKFGEDFIFDHRVILDDGKRIKFVQGIGRVAKDSHGKPVLVSGTCRDKTKDIEEENKYRSLFEIMSEGFVVQDSAGRIINHNRAALEILALTADQLHGRTSMDPRWRAFKEDGRDFPGHEHPAMVALSTGKPVYGATMGLKLPDDSSRWIRINAVPMKQSGESRVMVTFTDITKLVQAQEENRFILDTLGIGVWKYLPQTQELIWDHSMYQLFDINPSEFSGHYQAWESSLTENGRKQALEELGKALRGEKEFDTTFEIKTKSGEKRHIGGRGKIIRDPNNNPQVMYGINWDRTVEVENEIRLSEQRVLLESVLNNIPNMVFVKNAARDFSFDLFNKAGESLLGIPSDKLIGKNDFDLFPKEQAEFFLAKDREVFKTKQILKIDQEPLDTPHGKKWLRTYKVPTFKADGSPDLLIGISTDITEELELMKALETERTKSIQNSKLASLGEMSAGIAHEINNPLAVIIGNINLLKGSVSNPEKLDAKIGSIKRSAERIAKIVKGLRKFSRTSEGTIRKPESLNALVNEAMILTEAKAKRSFVDIKLDLQSNSTILCDGVEIEQVIVNLVNNAIDAVRHLEQKWVEIHTFEENNETVLQIVDSGTGIPHEIEQKLFQPFFTTKVVGEGTGLGLSISKGIIDSHQATLSLNKKLTNTCFEIRFPKLN